MTGEELFIALGDINQKYYDEAENDTAVRKFSSIRRPLLIAAAIAAALLLVGCGIVYTLRLQDMSIGQETYTQRFDDKGKAIEPVEKTRDIITVYGHSGDAIQQAMKEWHAFLESYNPDGSLLDNNPDHAEIPNQYEYTYSCYTREMADKVDEIAAKYNLKLLEEWIPFQRYQSDIFLEETGIHSLLLPDSGAKIRNMAGMVYPPYNFDMEFQLVTEDGGALWASCSYARKDYFPREIPGGMDLSKYQQWEHTAPGGTRLLLALSDKGYGWVIAELENAMYVITIDGNRSNSAYPDAGEIITKQELEAIADQFDYSIQPQAMDRAAVMETLAQSEAAYQAENAYEPETYTSFRDWIAASFVTAPEYITQYAYYDLNGDGEAEMLLGSDGYFTEWLTTKDGEVRLKGGMGTYLCEGGVVELYQAPDRYWDVERHYYFASASDTALYAFDEEEATRTGEMLTSVCREGDQWYRYGDFDGNQKTEISAEEAAATIAKYPRIQLEWKSLLDYPIDDSGKTLGSSLAEKDIRLSEDALLQQYKEYLSTDDDMVAYTHYRLLDVNGDGVKDLMLSPDGEKYQAILTYRYGLILYLDVASLNFYLCEDNVLDCVDTFSRAPGEETDGHTFIRLKEFKKEYLDTVAYNKATASWLSDFYGDPISEADGKAILAKYPRVDQGMQPISQLLKG